MPKTLQFRRGTTGELSSITGAPGELFVDTTKDVVVVSDGVTAGGFPLQSELVSNVNIKTINGTSVLGSGDITISGGNYGNANVAAYLPTYTGNLASLTGNVTTTANISGGNLLGTIATAAQPNITSVGTLTGLTSTGVVNLTGASNVSLGPVGNVKITGGSSGQVLTTDGAGNVSWQAGGGGGAITIQDEGANVVASATTINFVGSGVAASNVGGVATITVNGGGGNVDLSEITEDVLPMFSEVYDIGSVDKRWYDVYVGNKVDIAGAEITGSEAGVVVDTLLAGELLISDNLITPDASSARQYLGDKGVVVVNGNMDIEGDWALLPVVETIPGESYTAGDLDPTFDTGEGFTGAGQNTQVSSIALQPNGKILASGNFTDYGTDTVNGIARLNADGSIDTGFNNGGSGFDADFTGSRGPNSIVLQPDDKILAGGRFTQYNGTSIPKGVVRLNADGSLDTGFNNGGSGFNNGGSGSNSTVFKILLLPDGKVLAVGSFDSYNGTSTPKGVARLNADGSLDTGFNNGGSGFGGLAGVVTLAAALQPDGKILVGGSFDSYNGISIPENIARLNADGSIDTGFNNGGSGSDSQIVSVALQPDGKILVGGRLGSYNGTGVFGRAMIRLNADGSLDSDLDPSISGTFPSVQSYGIQLDGTMFIGGKFSSVNGTTQRSFAKMYYEDVTIPAVPPLTTGSAGMIRYNQDNGKYEGYRTKWQTIERVNSIPSDLPYPLGGEVDIDFSNSPLQILGELTGDVTYSGSNYTAGSSVTMKVTNGSSLRNLAFPADWVFVGTKPTDIAANKTAILTVTSFGTTEAECVAAWAVQT